MTAKNIYQQATFLTSVASLEQLPIDEGIEIAFIGRSNSGKSSAINSITGIKGLARSSKTPGRTQMINFFRLDENRKLVDLPGYGYAKVPLQVKKRWEAIVAQYIENRHSLKGIILIMDIRHPLKELDQQLLHWVASCHVPVHILLTKADKLSHGATVMALRQVEHELQTYPGVISVQVFSALDRTGLESAWKVLDRWMSSPEE